MAGFRWGYQTLICDMMVDAEYQKQGIGKKVMTSLLKNMRKEILSGFNYLVEKKNKIFIRN
ncbi:GNAT family N-acetyltransferase [Peribacillus asahii]|uniref:GNAT family N-acetyltransferase n=1 Tax=Peribacillus asahii TaxID=228899 RepID=UPI00381DBFD7